LLITLLYGAASLPAAPSEEAQRFLHPEQAAPGGVVTITAPEGGAFTAVLRNASGETVIRAESFRYSGEDGTTAVALLPLSSRLSAGEYLLQLYGSGGEEELYKSPLPVEKRDFRSEHIPLRASLTALRREPNPRKRREALEIQRIYARAESGDRYDTGPFIMPVEWRRISSYYGDRRVYEYSDGQTARSIHTGIDLAADVGTPVSACAAGRVVLAKERYISGYTAVIAHLPGVYSIYFHLHTLQVEQGEEVASGQRIGTVGMSGLATGPHLHWEIRVNGVAVDPRELTKRGIIESMQEVGADVAP
jgi:murein DD-endopeptidase MepM/ murein hydrolase activator NlpD